MGHLLIDSLDRLGKIEMTDRLMLAAIIAVLSGCAGEAKPSPLVPALERARAAHAEVSASAKEDAGALRELRRASTWTERAATLIDEDEALAALLIQTAEGAITLAKSALAKSAADAEVSELQSRIRGAHVDGALTGNEVKP